MRELPLEKRSGKNSNPRMQRKANEYESIVNGDVKVR